MDILKQINAALRAEYEGGMTQEEMAKRHNIAQGQIQKILSGKRTVAGLSLETFCKMFPRATVNLDGSNTAIADRGSTAIANAGTGNNFFTPAEDFKGKAISAIIDLDLPPEAMQTVLRAIKAL